MVRTEIFTERLKLRLIEFSDLNSIHVLHSFPEIDKYNTLGIPNEVKETENIVRRWIEQNNILETKNYTFAIELRSTSIFIGLFGLKLGKKKYRRGEVWYKIHPNFWKNGYATESLKSVINFGFEELNLHRIEAGCAVDNIASINVLEKVGMKLEGRFRQTLPLKSGWSDNFEFGILETDNRKK